MKKKLYIIGLDGAHFELFEKNKDLFPNMNRMIEKGSSAILKSTIVPLTGPAWLAFQTSKKIESTGIFDFFKYDKDLNPKFVTVDDVNAVTYYEILDNLGYKQFLINLPYTYPPKIKEKVIPCWLSFKDDFKQMVYPSSMMDKYPDIISYKSWPDDSKGALNFVKQNKDLFLQRKRLLEQLVDNEEFDVFFVLISTTDWLQHKVSHVIMKDKPGPLIKRHTDLVFKEMDKFIGKIMDKVDANTNIMVMSDHGFKKYEGVFYINKWLEDEGYLLHSTKGTSAIHANELDETEEKGFKLDINKLASKVPKSGLIYNAATSAFKLVNKYMPFVNLSIAKKIDIKNSKAFCASFGDKMIHINKEMYKEGSDEFDGIKAEILAKLNSIEGIEAHDAKKLLKEGNQAAGDIFLSSEKYTLYATSADKAIMNTTNYWHDRDGIFVGYGPEFCTESKLNEMEIVDLMPTILHMFGAEVPKNLDGKVVLEAFAPSSDSAKREVQYSDYEMAQGKEKSLLDAAIKGIKA